MHILAGPGDCCVPAKFLLAAGADRAEGPAPLRLVCEVCAPSQGLQNHPARVTASTAELHTSQVTLRELMPTERERQSVGLRRRDSKGMNQGARQRYH